MKKLLFLLIMAVMASGCSVTKKITKVDQNPDVTNFLNQTNLLYSNDRYWIKDIPEPEGALGSVYIRREEQIQGITYTAYSLLYDHLFGEISEANIRKESLTYSKDYTFKRTIEGDLSAMTVLSGNHSDISEIKKKVELQEVWGLKHGGLTPNINYCGSDYYYVTRVYFGSSSDFGLKEVKSVAKIAGVEVGAEVSSFETSTLHEIREKGLALMLQPTLYLSTCPKPREFDELALPKRLPEFRTLEDELIYEGYKKSK